MAKRKLPPSEGYPGLRSKMPKLSNLLPHERDYLSLPTSNQLSLPAIPPPQQKQQHHHRYDLRVRPPRPSNPTSRVVNGHSRREGGGVKGGPTLATAAGVTSTRWRNAHSYSLNYQQGSQRLSNASSSRSRRKRQPSLIPPKRKIRRRNNEPLHNENDLVSYIPKH